MKKLAAIFTAFTMLISSNFTVFAVENILSDNTVLNTENSETERPLTDENANILEKTSPMENVSISKEETDISETEQISSKVVLDDEEFDEIEEKINMAVLKLKEDKKNGIVPNQLVKDASYENNIEPRRLVFDEVEPNDTKRSADRVEVDYACYGTISDENDIDYYQIEFDQSGYLSISLRVPEFCDYDLYFVGSEGDMIACSERGKGKNEYIDRFVTAGVEYYIRIEAFGGYYDETEEYRMIFDLDDTITEVSYSVGVDYTSAGTNELVNTIQEARTALRALDIMGYNSYWTDVPTYDKLNGTLTGRESALESSVVTLHGHGGPGFMFFNHKQKVQEGNQYYYVVVRTNDNISHTGSPKYIDLVDLNLEGVRLMLFSGCITANTLADASYENLAKYANTHGAETTIGWKKDNVPSEGLRVWNEIFMEGLKFGYAVGDAADRADRLCIEEENMFEDSLAFYWRIYGNYANVLRLSGPREIQTSSNDVENIMSYSDSISVSIEDSDMTALEDYIQNVNPLFNAQIFNRKIKEIGDNLYKVQYNLYLNNIDYGCGYSVIVENNNVIRITPYGDMSVLKIKTEQEINVPDTQLKQALAEARAELEDSLVVEKQTVRKKYRNGVYYLDILTEYTGSCELGEYHGAQSYDYKIA
mgnify:CR=1 FL=1